MKVRAKLILVAVVVVVTVVVVAVVVVVVVTVAVVVVNKPPKNSNNIGGPSFNFLTTSKIEKSLPGNETEKGQKISAKVRFPFFGTF